MSNESKAPIPEDLRGALLEARMGYSPMPGEIEQYIERIARLEQENVQLLASHERLREALQRYRRRDDCKCGTCMNADAALRETEKLAESLQGVQGESGSIVFNVGEERK